MTTKEMTLDEVRARGFAALMQELGPVDYVRFIQQFYVGRGDYTRDRHPRVDQMTREQLEEMLAKARQHRQPS